ncbi:trimethyllysine dioxygenase, mitochondrial-like isoform X1 [Portunus trituberculatus]|uniref:trimethyllysine dioxygenase, mitochondrial-like isoform X1 n=1 Tax=Portunus trituberculatus TaxID=210409 RepID=UPI001E1D0579|nr:trimethyllysine dioxygenase, mitochondrial-like isoform X1 [Portunus trituberculatus]
MLHSVCLRSALRVRAIATASLTTARSDATYRCYGTRGPKEISTFDAGSRLEVQHPRWPHSLRFSYPWLRDHCRCNDCYNHTTAQRRFDPTHMHLNIRPALVSATPEGLELKWPDGHTSAYEYKFLWQNTYEGRRTAHKSPQQLWTARTFPKPELTTVSLGELNDTEKNGVKKLIAAIIKYGFAFISEVPTTEEATRLAVEKICPIKRNFFGEMWTFGNTGMDHFDTAYTSEFIGAHTDTTYFSQACRVQVFHCLEAACEGGENLLVDGFNVAQQFKDKHPEGYTFFSSKSFPSEYIEAGQHHSCLDTIFRHNPETGGLTQIRYNIYDRAPLSSIPQEKMQEFYLHFMNLTKVIRNPKNEHWLKLEPGKVLLIDNWRVMHGRKSFTGSRKMTGCYLGNDEFTSSARVLDLQLQ